MRLAVTEACTNVVRHAYSGADADDQSACGSKSARSRDGMQRGGRGPRARRRPQPRPRGPGLGLPLIAALADELEITSAPAAGQPGPMSFAAPVIEAA